MSSDRETRGDRLVVKKRRKKHRFYGHEPGAVQRPKLKGNYPLRKVAAEYEPDDLQSVYTDILKERTR